MSEPAVRYERMMRRLLDGRERGLFLGALEADEDLLLEEMDLCWWEMTAEERRETDRRLDEARSIDAPESLGVEDAESDDHLAPRRAA